MVYNNHITSKKAKVHNSTPLLFYYLYDRYISCQKYVSMIKYKYNYKESGRCVGMADLSTKDYKRFVGGIKEQYNNLLTEKETQLKNVEEDDKKLHDNICCKWAEYDMFCELYGITSQKAENVSDEIGKLIQEYDKEDNQTKIDNLKREIEWLKSKIQI